jgi:Glycosyl hydrolase family 76
VTRIGVVLFVLIACACASASGARADTGASVRAELVNEVEQGLAAVNKRWAWRGWYQDIPGVPGWSSIWDTEHLFQAYVALDRAEPTTRHRNMLIWFAAKSEEGYYNPTLGEGVGGFSTGFGRHGEQGQQWFDDNGWLGLSFVDAYRQTHLKRFLTDAERAFRYLYTVGWDSKGGGIWWNTQLTVKSAESVNTAALLAVELYELHAGNAYLADARRLIAWADENLRDPHSVLYVNHPGGDGVTISYLESPMLSAFMRLCSDAKLYCDRVAPFERAMLAKFGGALNQPPQFDAMYIRYVLDAYELSHDRQLYAVAALNAQRIEKNAVDADGYYSKAWDGGMRGVRPGLISVDGAALEVLGWTAAES